MTNLEKAALRQIIQGVLDTGKPWNDKYVHYPAEEAIKVVLAIKGAKKLKGGEGDDGEGFSTNGWQWDWWQEFTYQGQNYTLGGSGYYGGHSFNLSDE